MTLVLKLGVCGFLGSTIDGEQLSVWKSRFQKLGAQGCIIAARTETAAVCRAVCAAAEGKCDWTFNSTDPFNSTQMNNCGSCPPSCCNAVVAGECEQGCGFASGA